MSTTCQTIVDQARNQSVANRLTSLTSDSTEMLLRINASQQALYTRLADLNRYYYRTAATPTSTTGSGARSVDLSALTPPVERVIMVLLPDGTEVTEVDVQDPDAELAPRYYPEGQTLIEVGTDWNAASTAAVTLTVRYVFRPAALLLPPSGDLTQTVSVPDQFADILWIDLARGLWDKDPSRDPEEVARLDAKYEERVKDFAAYLEHFAGVEARRFVLPRPAGTKE